MEPSVLARSRAGAWAVVIVGLGVLAGRDGERVARADDAPPQPAASSGVSGPLCVLKGAYPLVKGTQIFDAATGGRAIANFTGAFAALELQDFPADPTTGRARLRTTSGGGSFRIEGYVAPAAVPVFTNRDLAVTSGHLWLSSAQRVRLVQASSNALTAELAVLGTSGQTVRATGGCDAFSLQPVTPTAMEVPGNGRGYLTKNATLDFFDAPNGNAIFTLRMMEGASHLFWSTESKSGFVHVQARADLTFDAWVRLREVEALKKGEMMDQFIPPTTQVKGAELALDKPPRLAQATREIALRPRRDEKAKLIGVIEVGAEFYVMETMVGWANVLPKNLAVMPPEDGGFWIPAEEVPKG